MNAESKQAKLIDKAFELAEKQLEEGTASAQVITHFLKLATEREKLERQKLEYESNLMAAKVGAIQAAEENAQKLEEVMNAMRSYGMVRDDADFGQDLY